MVIVSYDISDDKLRTKFSKYLSKFGHRLQYSVFEIDNSNRILDNIVTDIKNNALHNRIVLWYLSFQQAVKYCDSAMLRMTKMISLS